METMQSLVLVAHTLIAVVIIALVLLQRGKGADAGAGFGAGASGTVFGARGSSSFFSRATAILATAFFASSLTLAYISSQSQGPTESLLEDVPAVEAEQEPALTGTGESPDAGDFPDLPGLDEPGALADDEMPTLEPEPEVAEPEEQPGTD